MTWERPPCYSALEPLSEKTEGLQAWLSPEVSDLGWDAFLRNTPCGQYQQSSLWAEFKAGEGWKSHRVVLTDQAGIRGGFQIIWKKKGPVRIGYVSKGPVADPESTQLMSNLLALLVTASRELRLTALISQAPDETNTSNEIYRHFGFIQSNPLNVIEATCVVDLKQELEVIRSQLSSSLRRNLRRAHKLSTTIHQGSMMELETFFQLMAAICERQKTPPNPPNVAALQNIWRAFSHRDTIRLSLAECDGHISAATLSLGFGDRLTAWKKGWNGTHSSHHPNEVLRIDSLEWAHAKGFRLFDFCSFDRKCAERLLAGENSTSLQLSSRDEYHLRFGGRPQLLPRAEIHVPNRVLRWAYRQAAPLMERWRQRRPTVTKS